MWLNNILPTVGTMPGFWIEYPMGYSSSLNIRLQAGHLVSELPSEG